MDTERNLLFGIVAFQNGAVEADRLAESCAAWVTEPTRPLADLMVGRGLMTDEQRTEVDKAVEQELAIHGGNLQETLAATLDGRSLDAIGPVAGAGIGIGIGIGGGVGGGGVGAARAAQPGAAPVQGGHVVLGTLSPGEVESRERYTLTHLHAKGGMGRVWLARDGALGRQIALKELRPDQADNSIVCSRFLYEAKITAQLEHPGIVPVYELGEGNAPYYTMRFVRGRTLSEAIRASHKKRATGEADSVGLVELLTAFAGVCHAVAYAHSRGIIHRDLKGQNVVLGDFGEVIVLDWGLAKRVGPDSTPGEGTGPVATSLAPEAATAATRAAAPGHDAEFTLPEGAEAGPGPAPGEVEGIGSRSSPGPSANGSAHPANSGSGSGPRVYRESGAGPEGTMQGQLLGTPAYMAPEQAKGRHDLVDQRTDIYGLGAILYEILTGRPPFIAPRTAEVIRKVCQEAPTPPRQIVAEIAPGLEAVCLKALCKEPSDRYTTAAELAQEVRRWLADEPVLAYAEPWTRRAARWARRHKTAVSAAAGLLGAAAIALAVSTVLISGERNEAEAQGQQARHAVHLLTKAADVGFDEQLDPLQKEFLENALAYYEKFTSRVSRDPVVQWEHGRAYQKMGDIQRKLGKLTLAEQAYRRSAERLEPLAIAAGNGREARQALARTRTLLADLLVRRGADKGQADALYRQAVEAQRPLADAKGDPAATLEDHLRLGQTLRSQAELLRLDGRFTQAKPVYDQSVAELERSLVALAPHPPARDGPARAGAVKPPAPDAAEPPQLVAEIRNELAWAVDARGWIHRDLGEIPEAERDFRRALELLDALVAEFPTRPRYREALAKACNSLGILEQEIGRLDDAEAHLRREVPLAERLAQDFPDQPEYRRVLARALNVFGGVLRLQGHLAEAEPALRRAIDLDTAVLAQSPDDVLVRFQLAMAHQHLGEILMKQGHPETAVTAYRKARTINEALAREFPNKPRYASDLAANLDGLALALNAAGQHGADEHFRAANALFERLTAAHPDQVDYRIWYATTLRNQGLVLAEAGRPEDAEPLYRKALNLLEAKDPRLQAPEGLRKQAEVLSNLGLLHRPGAEDAFHRSIAISEKLLAGKSGTLNDRYHLAVAQNNLADFLATDRRPVGSIIGTAIAQNDVARQVIAIERLPEAGPYLAQSVANFEELVAAAPRSMEFHHTFGVVLAGQATWLEQTGKPAEARAALTAAVDHQRQAAQLSRNAPVCTLALAGHLIDRAEINLELGAYDEAAKNALEVPQTAPLSGRPQACYDAARVLARLVARASTDDKLHPAERDRLTRNYLLRTVALLREAIDSAPALAGPIKADREIRVLAARPQFQAIMNTLVDVAP